MIKKVSGNMKWFSILMIVGIILFSFCHAFAETQVAYTSKGKVNVRSQPDAESKVVIQIEKKGTEITVLALVSGKGSQYYEVYAPNGEHGYIRADLLDGLKTVQDMSSVASLSTTVALQAVSSPMENIYQLVPYSVPFEKNQKFEVYSGPGTDYYRGANGKAAVSTNDWIEVYGTEDGWALVQYAVNNNQFRIGYIQAKHLPETNNVPQMVFLYVQRKIECDTSLTDDPNRSQAALKTIQAGDSVTLLAQLNGWYYVESGNMRGFIDPSSVETFIDSSAEESPIQQISPEDPYIEQNKIDTIVEKQAYEVKMANDVLAAINTAIGQIIDVFTDEEGYLENNEEIIHQSALSVFHFAERLKAQGSIKDCTFCEEAKTVALVENNGGTILYIPKLKDTYAGAAADFSVMGFNSIAGFENFATSFDGVMYFTNSLGSLSPTQYLHEHAEEYSKKDYFYCSGEGSNYENVKRYICSIAQNNTRVFFWRGHGSTFDILTEDEMIIKSLWLGLNQFYDPSDPVLSEAYINGYINICYDKGSHYGQIGVTTSFFDEYLPAVEGGAFIAGSCHSMDDNGNTAKIFFKHGFDAYVGVRHEVWDVYSDNMLYCIAKQLSNKDENNHYIPISTALTNAEQENAYYRNEYQNGFGYAYFDMYTNPDTQEFRLVPLPVTLRFIVEDIYGDTIDSHISLQKDDFYFEFDFGLDANSKWLDSIEIPGYAIGTYELTVAADGYQPYKIKAEVKKDDTITCFLKLDGTIAGFVTDIDSGGVIPGVSVVCTRDKIASENFEKYSSEVSTDSNGFYSFDGLDSGTYHLKFTKEFYQDESMMVELSADNHIPNVSVALKMKEYGDLTGFVKDAETEEALAGVSVHIVDENGSGYYETTDASGRFHYNKIPVGFYTIECKKSGYQQDGEESVRVNAGAETVLMDSILMHQISSISSHNTHTIAVGTDYMFKITGNNEITIYDEDGVIRNTIETEVGIHSLSAGSYNDLYIILDNGEVMVYDKDNEIMHDTFSSFIDHIYWFKYPFNNIEDIYVYNGEIVILYKDGTVKTVGFLRAKEAGMESNYNFDQLLDIIEWCRENSYYSFFVKKDGKVVLVGNLSDRKLYLEEGGEGKKRYLAFEQMIEGWADVVKIVARPNDVRDFSGDYYVLTKDGDLHFSYIDWEHDMAICDVLIGYGFKDIVRNEDVLLGLSYNGDVVMFDLDWYTGEIYSSQVIWHDIVEIVISHGTARKEFYTESSHYTEYITPIAILNERGEVFFWDGVEDPSLVMER